MAKSKAKRKAGAPEFAVKPKRKGAKIVRDEVRMGRVRQILARTAAARAQIDARLVGVDMSDLEHLPVVEFPSGRAPKVPGMRSKHRHDDEPDDPDEDEIEEALDDRPPIAPPVPFVPELERAAGILNPGGLRKPIACSACGAVGHRSDSRTCPKHPSAVLLPVKIEAVEADIGIEERAHEPLPPNAILRHCKACGRPRCRSDSRFCPKNHHYDPDNDTRLAGAGGALRDECLLVLDHEIAARVEEAAAQNCVTVEELLLLMIRPRDVRNRPSLHERGEITQRQRECVELFVAGQSYRQIARQLGISVGGVKAHVRAARVRDPLCVPANRAPNIPVGRPAITPAHAPESGDVSTVVERSEPQNIPASTPSAFFGEGEEPTQLLGVWASRQLLEAFEAIASRLYPDATEPSALMVRDYMVKVAWGQAEPGHAIPRARKLRGPYKCSACGAVGHRADSRKCPTFTGRATAVDSAAA